MQHWQTEDHRPHTPFILGLIPEAKQLTQLYSEEPELVSLTCSIPWGDLSYFMAPVAPNQIAESTI
jgi:hypothetical protein